MLLSTATLSEPATGNLFRIPPALAAALKRDLASYPDAPRLYAVYASGPQAGVGEGGEADDRYDLRQDVARLRALGAILAESLVVVCGGDHRCEEDHHAAASPVRDEAPLSSSAPELVTPPQAPAPAPAERSIVLALLPRDRAPGGVADDVPGGITTDLPAGLAGVSASQAPATSPGDPPPTDPVWAAAWPLDPPPFDLSAVQRGVDEFFARLADLGQAGGGRASLPLVPAVILATALAYEWGRRWGAKKAAAAPPAEDLVADLSEEVQ
jgi:hypothetical protein